MTTDELDKRDRHRLSMIHTLQCSNRELVEDKKALRSLIRKLQAELTKSLEKVAENACRQPQK